VISDPLSYQLGSKCQQTTSRKPHLTIVLGYDNDLRYAIVFVIKLPN